MFLNGYSARSKVKKGHFGGLIFHIFVKSIEKFNIKVSFRLKFSYMSFGGGDFLTVLIRCAAAS